MWCNGFRCCSFKDAESEMRTFVLKLDIHPPSVAYLADQEPPVLLWVLSLWVLCPLCHPGHLQSGKIRGNT